MCNAINLFATFFINDNDSGLFSNVTDIKINEEICKEINEYLPGWDGTLYQSKTRPDAYGIFPVDIYNTESAFNALSRIVYALLINKVDVSGANVEEINFIVHDKMLDESLTKEDYMFVPNDILFQLIEESPIKEFKGTVHLLSFQHTSNPVVDMLTSEGLVIQEEINRLLTDE